MLKVLVVDDMPVFLAYMQTIIPWETHGFTLVGSAKDGQEALEMAKHLCPDIILTDITMPHMDGLTFAQGLKQILPHASVVMITGHTEFQYAHSALKLGASDYLIKPFDAQELLITLLKLKQSHQKQEAQLRLYSDLTALSSATLLRQLVLTTTTELAYDFHEEAYMDLPLVKSLKTAFGCRLAAISFPEVTTERQSIAQILANTLADGMDLFTFTDYDNHLIVLLCYPTQQDTAFYRDSTDKLLKAIKEKLDIALHMGISDLVTLPAAHQTRDYPLLFPLLQKAFAQALTQLHQLTPSFTFISAQGKRQRIASEMKAFLDGHFDSPKLHMDIVAKALLINQTDLRAAFKSEMGMTMTDYVLKLRMEAAQTLIQTGEYKLSEVAEKVGYEDQAYFSRCYKKYYGQAPLKHHRQGLI